MNGCLNILQKTTGVTFPNKTCIFPVVYAFDPYKLRKSKWKFLCFHFLFPGLLVKVVVNIKTWFPRNPTTGHIPWENHNSKDTCIPMFFTVLLIIARTQKQPKYPSIGEWIKKLWYIYTIEYYSTLKRNKFESVELR